MYGAEWHHSNAYPASYNLPDLIIPTFDRYIMDMDMSKGLGINKIWRVRSAAHSHSHKWRHVAPAMHANNVLRNSYNTPTAMSAHNVLHNSLRRAVNHCGGAEQWPECVYILKVVYSELFQ
jgi:hypothetical protein